MSCSAPVSSTRCKLGLAGGCPSPPSTTTSADSSAGRILPTQLDICADQGHVEEVSTAHHRRPGRRCDCRRPSWRSKSLRLGLGFANRAQRDEPFSTYRATPPQILSLLRDD